MAQRKTVKRTTRTTKTEVNPHIATAQQNGKAAAKVVRKNAEVAASKTKAVAGAVAGGIALGLGIAVAFGGAFAKGLRG